MQRTERVPILVVEDDEGIALLQQRALQRRGHIVEVTHTAVAAMARLRDRDFALLVLDHRLGTAVSWPVLDAAQSQSPSVPVVLVTAMGDERIAAEALRRGAMGYVIKGEDFCDQLVSYVEKILRLVEAERDNARMAAIIAATDDAIVSYTLGGEILTWNPGAERMFGYGAAEVLGRSAEELISSELHEQRQTYMTALLRGEAVPPFQTFRRRKDGSRVHVSVSLSPLRSPGQSAISAVVVIARDISVQVAAEDSRRRSEQRFRRLVESNIVGVHIARGSDIVEANDCFLALIGYAQTDLPLRFDLLTPPEYQAQMEAMTSDLTSVGRAAAREKEYLTRDGRRVPVLIALTDIGDGEVLGVTLDLSSSKALEKQLYQAQKMEGIGRLAGGVAHDFNNLLTIINGYCQIMRDSLHPSDPMRIELDEVHDAGQRAARLTGQLLAFCRKQVVQPQPVDVNEVISNLTRMLRRLIGEDIQLETRLAPDLPRVWVDVGQMEQVLVNLVVNARDAMPSGGRLNLETNLVDGDESETLGPGPLVRLSVADTGSGMDPETAAHIFEPFFTTKAAGKGTGLGLSTVYGIVQQSNGLVTLDTEPGHGTTFRIYLPRCEREASDTGAEAVPYTAHKGSEVVLVVEDDAPVSGFVRTLLTQAGYQVLCAGDGEAALSLARARSEPIDLLLTDLVMPRLGGRALATALRSLHPETRVMYMSGYADDSVPNQGGLEPGTSFVAKPFAPEVLLQTIRKVLTG